MMTYWRQLEGQLLNHPFVLGAYLGGSDNSAVFFTEYGQQKALVKLFPADPASVGQLSRLEAASQLSHPHQIRVLTGVCVKGDLPLLYVVMEYAAEDLSQVLADRALTPSEMREVLVSALDALAYLHREGFVHGRLKPTNILAVDDRVKISSDLLSWARTGFDPRQTHDLGRARVSRPTVSADPRSGDRSVTADFRPCFVSAKGTNANLDSRTYHAAVACFHCDLNRLGV